MSPGPEGLVKSLFCPGQCEFYPTAAPTPGPQTANPRKSFKSSSKLLHPHMASERSSDSHWQRGSVRKLECSACRPMTNHKGVCVECLFLRTPGSGPTTRHGQHGALFATPLARRRERGPDPPGPRPVLGPVASSHVGARQRRQHLALHLNLVPAQGSRHIRVEADTAGSRKHELNVEQSRSKVGRPSEARAK